MNGRRRFSQRQFGGNWNNPYPAVAAQNFGMTLAELFNPYSRTNRAGSNASTLNALKLADAAGGVRLNRQKALDLEHAAKQLAKFEAEHPNIKNDPLAIAAASKLPLKDILRTRYLEEARNLVPEYLAQFAEGSKERAAQKLSILTELGGGPKLKFLGKGYGGLPLTRLGQIPDDNPDVRKMFEGILSGKVSLADKRVAQTEKIRALTPGEVNLLKARMVDLGTATNLKNLRGFLVQANTRLSKLQALSKKYELENIDPKRKLELDVKIKKLKAKLKLVKIEQLT